MPEGLVCAAEHKGPPRPRQPKPCRGHGPGQRGPPGSPARPKSSKDGICNENQVYFRHGRGAVFPGQGAGRRFDRRAAPGPGAQGHHPETRSLHQRRSGHDEPVPARRGLRHRRWGRNGPRSRALRALSRRAHEPEQQFHLGAHLFQRDPERAPGATTSAARSR